MTAQAVWGDIPKLEPVIAVEATDYGWRGLTANGEVYEVQGNSVPSSIMVHHRGQLVGEREITRQYDLNFDDYLKHYNHAVEVFRLNEFEAALAGFDAAIAMAP